MVFAEVEAPAGMLEALKKFAQNSAWAKSNAGELDEHVGRYVAVHDGKIIALSDDIRELHRKFASRPEVFITFVAPEGLAWVL